MIAIVSIIILGVLLLAIAIMAHQAHMRDKSTGGYLFGLIFIGFVLYMAVIMGAASSG